MLAWCWIGCSANALWMDSAEAPVGRGAGDSAQAHSGVEQVPGGPVVAGDCADLYDPEMVPVFEVEIEPAEWAGLEHDYAEGRKRYHPAVFRYGDEQVDDAQIRLKGNPSFSWFTQKMQFVISFNETDPDGRFHGLRKLALDAAWYEPTLLRDRVAWSGLRRQGGLPSACANSAQLVVNGEVYGLYSNIEYLDHEWLERVFGDAHATGALYKYGTEPVSNADAATGAVERAFSASSVDKLAQRVELDQWLLEWAAEAVIGDDDGYWCCQHNFYLYEHPTRGVLFVPWDLDDTFDVQGYDVDPIQGYHPGLFQPPWFQEVVNHPTWAPVFREQLAAVNAAMDPVWVLDELDRWAAQLRELVRDDPNRSFGWEEHEQAVARFRAWIPARHAFLDSWLACAEGSTADADGDGYPVCTDPHDADPGVYPGAPELCDGVDNDADGEVDNHPDCEDCARHDVDDLELLFCRWPRSAADAQAHCAEEGGRLWAPRTTEEQRVVWFYAWPVLEHWWTGSDSGSTCPTWNEQNASPDRAACAEEHPSLCRL